MEVLSVNAGRSSIKFLMYEMPEEKVLISGVFERIGLNDSLYTIKVNGEKLKKQATLNDHNDAVRILIEELFENKVISSLDEIKGIGHRVVQGGDYFNKTVVIDDEVIAKIDELSTLAPLHNPAAITGIKAAQAVVPDAVQTAVFDTAFHQTMDEVNYMYAVPYSWYTDYKISR